ncbi:hypothetical protein LBMAG57_29920 [Verrucomicrobiota bacterium]|nr:hypothetical protein LBMAG57_29920 [Verrucomicrobiota bacterium]
MSRFVTPLSLVTFLGLLPPVQGEEARSPAGKSAPLQSSAVLGSHMVLPRDMPVPVWGLSGAKPLRRWKSRWNF